MGTVRPQSAQVTLRKERECLQSPSPKGSGRPEPLLSAQVVRESLPPRPAPPAASDPSGVASLVAFLVLALLGSLFMNLILAVAAGLGLAGSMETNHRVQEKYFSNSTTAQDKIAIISIEGVILESEDGFAKRQIDQAIEDKSVKAIVLRVDSPGGSVTGSDFIYHHLLRLKKKRDIPIVVSMGSIAASGGYYVSMAVGQTPNTIFAEPTGFTGSIGVLIPHYNFEGLLGKIGAKDDTVASHPLKTMGSFSKPMTDEERKIFQALVDDNFKRFKEIVRSGRLQFQEGPDGPGQARHRSDLHGRSGKAERAWLISSGSSRTLFSERPNWPASIPTPSK